ncbi:MAG: arsenate reductase ArsC [Ginsengibacter sp.]
MKKILILCTGNSCRSQMAEGYIRHFAGNKAEVSSAGIEAHGVNPMAIAVMKEDGIDISNHTSKNVSEFMGREFDVVITVCDHAKENCPYFPGKAKMIHQDFNDPAKATGREREVMEEFRKVRNAIKSFSREFVEQDL